MCSSNSCLMAGNIRHRRFTPVSHSLNYQLFMPCIDLDEIVLLEQSVYGFGRKWWHWARFRREDYLGTGDIKQAVFHKVKELGGNCSSGSVRAVVHLRYFGIYFSPVNFYYVYDSDGEWRYLLAEVSNTPWNERHYYLLDATDTSSWQHNKAFHVSPFNPVEQRYQWRIHPIDKHFSLHLECHREIKEFDATLSMKRHEFSSRVLIKFLIRTPIMAVKVTAGIYWHALKLWLKGATFYSHPKYQKSESPQPENKAK